MTRSCWRPGSKQGKAAWGVRLYHRDDGAHWAGTSHLDVTGDTLDLTCFMTWSVTRPPS